ncbi:tetratricopeptide repeat protein [Phytoactinopolyspora mesophila]|nr:tetratricopeptide repeat protein [Phytoactinopolyspora mesophila]
MTITGTAGVGKTRLAIAAGNDLGEHFAGAVGFVDLAAVPDSGLVVPTMAAALGLTIPVGADGALDAFLAMPHDRQRTLVVLDNFEHVVDAGSDLARVLSYCPWLQLLVTSRERLRLRGEQEIEVPPLPVPDPAMVSDTWTVRENPAIALFVHSTQAIVPGFDVEESNAQTLAELVRRLEGVPLAVELAAGHMSMLSAAQILDRLQQPLDVLSNGPRDLPERQRTLRSALDWSYHLLDEEERRVFRCLSVFRGGCDIASAAEIVGAPDSSAILPVIRSLMDKSLVIRVAGSATTPRLGMLEYIREYAAELLRHAGELDACRDAHATRFAALAADGGRALITRGGQGAWLDRLELDHDNLRAALEWTSAGPEPVRRLNALAMSTSLAEFWFIRGYFEEGARWLRVAVEGAGAAEPPLLAMALAASGRIAFGQGRYAEASSYYQEAIDRARQGDLHAELAAALTGMAEVHAYLGTYGSALELLRDSAAIHQTLGDAAGHARVTNSLGLVHLHQGRNQDALSLFQRGLVLFGELDDTWGMAWSLSNAADAERSLGQLDSAEQHYTQALETAGRIGLSAAMAASLEGLSAIDAARGHHVDAIRRYAAAREIRDSIGSSTSPDRHAVLERVVDQSRAILGLERFDAAWAEGRAASARHTFTTAFSRETNPDTHGSADPPIDAAGAVGGAGAVAISNREREVAALVARGMTNRRLARALGISENTVGRHLENIYRKLSIRSRTELAAWAFNGGLPELTSSGNERHADLSL